MPSTRSGQEPKNQRAAAEAESEASASNDFVAPPSPAPVVAPSPVMKSASNGAPVVMMVTGHWNPPPGIGEIEMILRSSSRMQHRIMRIEVRAECAFVEVHPQDVAVCTGVFELGGVQLHSAPVGEGVGNTPMSVPLMPSPAKRASPHSSNGPIVASSLAVGALSAKKRAKVDFVGAAEVTSPHMSPFERMPPFGEVHQMAMRASSVLSVSSISSACSPGMPTGGFSSKKQETEEEKQRRLYRVGLSYRCGRCGKPKKGHVCDVPEGEEGAADFGNSPFGDGQRSPQPAILATTVRKGTPPVLLCPLTGAPSAGSPLADVKIAGEASTIFKDMVAALGENTSSISLASPVQAAPSPGAPPRMVSAAGISPLAASAIAAGSVSSVAAHVAPVGVREPQEPALSEMDMMLADLAFSARPPPVMTPNEDGNHEDVHPSFGSISPSAFSPGSMIQQLLTATPGGTSFASGLGLDMALSHVLSGGAAMQMPQQSTTRRATVIAQPAAV